MKYTDIEQFNEFKSEYEPCRLAATVRSFVFQSTPPMKSYIRQSTQRTDAHGVKWVVLRWLTKIIGKNI